MGSTLSFIVSPETILVAIVTGTTVYGYILYSNSGISPKSNQLVTDEPSTKPSKAKKKKQTAKNAGAAPSPLAAAPSVSNEIPTPPSRQKGKSVAPVGPAVTVSLSHGNIPGEFEVTADSVSSSAHAGAGAAVSDSNEPVPKSNKGKKKNKKNAKKTGPVASGHADPSSTTPSHVSSSSGDVPAAGTSSASSSKVHGSVPANEGLGISPQPRSQPEASSSIDTDSSWTRVETHRQKASKSKTKPSEGGAPSLVVSTDVTTSDVGTSTTSPVTGQTTDEEEPIVHHETQTRTEETDTSHRRTLAEKLVPKPRKTGLEDMVEQPDFPTLARVMRVQPRPGETPAPGFTWEDYEDVDQGVLHADEEDEGEWGVVKGKSRSRTSRTTTPVSIPTSTPSVQQDSSETMSKKQRQNAKKRELMKAAKAEAEAARLAGLAKHKRELERQRVMELSRQGGGKSTSGGMQASVDHRGKLVWE